MREAVCYHAGPFFLFHSGGGDDGVEVDDE